MFQATDHVPAAQFAYAAAHPLRRIDVNTARIADPRITSKALLGAARDLVIEHAGQEYRLHLTRNDKLILTK